MCKFLGLVDNSIIDVLVRKVEDTCQCYHHFENCAPDSFCNSELHSSGACFPEQGSNRLVGVESLDDGKQVVLYGGKRSACDLGSEIPSLALAESQQALAVLEDDLQGPSLGINPVCLKEVKGPVCRDESVPGPLLAASDEEETDFLSAKMTSATA